MRQPLGVIDGPAGALLLPPLATDDSEARERVMRGDAADVPAAWAFYACAAEGDRQSALAALGDDAFAAYNRFVLTGKPELYAALASELAGDERLLLEAAAYAHGVIDEPPSGAGDDALVRAYLALITLEPLHAVAAANEVAELSPLLAARLIAQYAASIEHDPAATDAALAALERVREIFAAGGHSLEAAQFALRYGLLAHERYDGRRERLLAAVYAYQRALQTFTKDGPQREHYALAHMNLGLAYLALPMNDEAERLRPAIAIQSLREAASALDPRRSPDLWAGATLNLANALQHVRSTHVEENLWEAVALYEDILPLIAHGDPVRKARVLASEGNALAHLGAFSRAVPRLNEARAIFALAGDADSTTAIDATLDDIAVRAQAAGSSHGTA